MPKYCDSIRKYRRSNRTQTKYNDKYRQRNNNMLELLTKLRTQTYNLKLELRDKIQSLSDQQRELRREYKKKSSNNSARTEHRRAIANRLASSMMRNSNHITSLLYTYQFVRQNIAQLSDAIWNITHSKNL